MKKKLGILVVVCLLLVMSGTYWLIKNTPKSLSDVSDIPQSIQNIEENNGEDLVKGEPQNNSTENDSEVSTIQQNDAKVQEGNSVSVSNPTQLPSSKTDSSPQRLIKVGDTVDVVIEIMGDPDKVDTLTNGIANLPGHQYIYRKSSDPFAPVSRIFLVYEGNTEKVVGWWDNAGVLKVTAGEKNSSAPAITLGSSKEDVAKAMGTPYIYEPNFSDRASLGFGTSWYYQQSSIKFDTNYKVIGWDNRGNLKVSMGVKIDSAPPINFDSTVQDIVMAMGTPLRLTENPGTNRPYGMAYEKSIVYLDDNGKVYAWENNGDLKVSLGERDPNSKGIKIGSTMDEAVKALGTPQRVQLKNSWTYGNSYVEFNQGKIVRILNAGNLKIDNSN